MIALTSCTFCSARKYWFILFYCCVTESKCSNSAFESYPIPGLICSIPNPGHLIQTWRFEYSLRFLGHGKILDRKFSDFLHNGKIYFCQSTSCLSFTLSLDITFTRWILIITRTSGLCNVWAAFVRLTHSLGDMWHFVTLLLPLLLLYLWSGTSSEVAI